MKKKKIKIVTKKIWRFKKALIKTTVQNIPTVCCVREVKKRVMKDGLRGGVVGGGGEGAGDTQLMRF